MKTQAVPVTHEVCMPDLLSLDTFRARLGEHFTVALAEGGTHTLTLFEATALAPHPFPNKQREPFQLKFRGPGPVVLLQRTHVLHHAELGEVTIFLVPIGQDGPDFIYQAIYT